MGINCSLKASTRIIGVILFLSATHTHTLNTGWHKYGSRLKARGRLNCSLKSSTRTHAVILSFKCDSHTHFEYRMVRIWFLTEGARKIESWGPGITRQGRRRSWRRVSWVPEIPRRTTAKVVLESWCYTRKGVHPAVFQADCGAIPGNSQRCDTRYKFPRRWQRWSLRPGVIPGVLE